MAYTILKEHNGIELSYWKITQRNACSAGRVDWVVELSGYTSAADRLTGRNPFDARQIVFTPEDNPITAPETEAIIDDNRDFADADAFGKHVCYTHITRLADIAQGKTEEERSAAESACLFFYGAEEV